MLKQWNDAADRLLTADGSSEKRAESTYLYGKMMRAAKEHKEGKYLLSTPAQEWPFSVMTLKSFLASLTNWDEYSKRCYRDRNGYKGSSTVIDDMQKAVCYIILALGPWPISILNKPSPRSLNGLILGCSLFACMDHGRDCHDMWKMLCSQVLTGTYII